MISLKNYSVTHELSSNINQKVYRAQRKANKEKVILKIPQIDAFNVQTFPIIKHEFEINQKIPSKYIIKAIELDYDHEVPILVLEDIGGMSLKHFLKKRNFSLYTCLLLMIKLTKALGEIHDFGIIHKDIKPENMILNPNTGDIRITDFGISSLLAQENSEAKNPEKLEGSLAYLSPEQTGRMNRSIDYRSDYYSLGIVFYEILTLQLPFSSKDPLELVHCHIAKNPTPPEQINPQIPPVVSEIVLKLMAKSADDRYKSQPGLLADLEECLNQYKTNKIIKDFPLARFDISTKFQLAKKLYGRDQEIEQLIQAYDTSAKGVPMFLLVGGYSGMGKSALVNEIHKPVVEKRGYFLTGKFDQFQRDIPYSAFLAAFQNLTQQILTETPEKISNWKSRIQKGLGQNAQVMLDLIPELRHLLDEVPEISELAPTEAQNRLENTFLHFIKTIAQKDSPIVLFLDDVQWADSASFLLLKILLTGLAEGSILIISAYRNNEVNQHHPLIGLLDELKRQGKPPIEISLSPLLEKDIKQLLADSTQRQAEETGELAQLVKAKTEGNPFFVGEFLKDLSKRSLLKIEKGEKIWSWNLKDIQALSYTDNVVDILIERIQSLSQEAQNILKLASCLGATFVLSELVVVSEMDSDTCIATIWEILREGIISPIGETASHLQVLKFQPAEKTGFDLKKLSFHFIHDKLQQAANQLIAEEDKVQIHYRIGSYLLHNYKQQEKNKKGEADVLVQIVSHLNLAHSIIGSKKERFELAQLNSQIAKKAENSAAYSSALDLLHQAISLLPENSWEEEYSFSYDLYIRLAQCSYICGDFTKSEELFSVLLQKAKNSLDKAKVYEIQVVQLANQNQLKKAVDQGLKGLKLFHVDIGKSPSLPRVLAEVTQVWRYRKGKAIESLIDLPRATDPNTIMISRLLNHLTSPSYGTDQNLFALIVVKAVILALTKGVTEYSAYMFGLYAALVGSKLFLFSAGEKYGKLGVAMSEQFSNLAQRCRANFAMGTFVYAWTNHSLDSFSYSLESFRLARETGENVYSCYSIVEYCSKLMSVGKNLEETQDIIGKYTEYVVNHVKDRWIGTLMLAMNQSLLCLLGKTRDKLSLNTENFDEEKYVQEINQEGEGQMNWYHTNKAKIFFLYGEYEKALEMLKIANEKMVYSFATIVTAEQNFYHSLTLCALMKKNPSKRIVYLAKVSLNQTFLKIWSISAPENFLHKYYLVKAEVYQVKKKYKLAKKYYDKAIQEAHERDYYQNEALANELAAQFYENFEQTKASKAYITDAFQGYARWGASHKMNDLKQQWKQQILNLKLDYSTSTISKTITATTNLTSIGSSGSAAILDIYTIMKASQIISDEMRISSLLEKMIEILIENAGAETGSFLLNKQNKLFQESSSKINSGKTLVDMNTPLEESKNLPISLIHYVARTQETLVIPNAMNHPLFKSDPYIQSGKIRSIYCMPILYQTKLFGIVYLENNLTTDAFSTSRTQMLQMLSSQISISLNNSTLYTNMERMANSFSRFVPKEFLEHLGKKRIMDINLGDAMQHKMTILFSDIRGFTSLSETMDVHDNFNFLNSYLQRMEPLIQKHNGFIDKFIGDAIMALFPQDAINGLKSAIAMKLHLKLLNQERLKKNYQAINIGIGLHVGDVMLGTLGSKNRLETTVIGDTVNLASRLEGLTNLMGTKIIVSESIVSSLGKNHSFQLRSLGLAQVRGKEIPIQIYEVIDEDPTPLLEKKLQTYEKFQEAIHLYQNRDFENAQKLFADILAVFPEDVPSKQYLESSKILMQNEPNTKLTIHIRGGDYISLLKGGRYPKTFMFVADSNREYSINLARKMAFRYSPYSDRSKKEKTRPLAKKTGKTGLVNGIECEIYSVRTEDTQFMYYVHDDYKIDPGSFPKKIRARPFFLVPGLEGKIPLKVVKRQKQLTVTQEVKNIKAQAFNPK
ncbi:MAG: AAA family ATPase, partial [Spirochaetota bacterium]